MSHKEKSDQGGGDHRADASKKGAGGLTGDAGVPIEVAEKRTNEDSETAAGVGTNPTGQWSDSGLEGAN